METGLRILLLVIACIIVAGIVWDYRNRRKPGSHERNHAFARKNQNQNQSHQPSIIVLQLRAKHNRLFTGPKLLEAFEAMHLFYGDRQIFYGYQYPKATGSNRGARLFSVVSMVEPGFFDLKNIRSFSTPGISLFLVLDEEMQACAFESILKTATALASLLDGDLSDQHLQPLNAASIQAMRTRVATHLAQLCTPDLAIEPERA